MSPHFLPISTAVIVTLSAVLSTAAYCGTATGPNNTASVGSKIDSPTLSRVGRAPIDKGVLIFFEPTCPICLEYLPELERLNSVYGSQLPFQLVVKPSVSPLTLDQFLKEYRPTIKVTVDEDLRLQRALGASITPEAFLIKDNIVCYGGRIDDRYVALGRRRAVITSHDLRLALENLNNGPQHKARHTQAVGCYLELH